MNNKKKHITIPRFTRREQKDVMIRGKKGLCPRRQDITF
jgi:hypothetical protein